MGLVESKMPLTRMVLFVVSIALAGCYQERNDSIRLMNQGLSQAKRGSVSQGLKTLAEAAKVDPTNHRALYYQGMLYVKRSGEFERGAELLKAAIKLKDTNHEYYYHLGHAVCRAACSHTMRVKCSIRENAHAVNLETKRENALVVSGAIQSSG